MDKPKAKNGYRSLRIYWYFYIPLTVILSLMVFFPIRIHIEPDFTRNYARWLSDDRVFYSALLLLCMIFACRVVLRFRKRSKLLVILALVCVLLPGWQVFDLAILRTDGATGWMNKVHYGPRFQDYPCHTISEQYITGNKLFAIAYNINRYDAWPGCGG